MSPIVVLFLMDFIPDFQLLLDNNLKANNHDFNISTCDHILAKSIWQQVNDVQDLSLIFNFDDNQNYTSVDKYLQFQIEDSEDMKNSSQKSYLPDISLEEFKLLENLDLSDLSNIDNVKPINKYVENDLNIIEKSPFLVAIFETFENVTAQTCSGTLLSGHYVLTLTSCMELLCNLHLQNTTQNKNNQTIYTIIANAGNPLLDGTVHNVTKIMWHSKHNNVSASKIMKHIPGIVIMRIEPPVHGTKLNILNKEIQSNASIRVFGWELIKSSKGSVMKAISFEVDIVRQKQRGVPRNALKCFLIRSKSDKGIEMMNSGGPILAIEEDNIQLFGVAQAEANSLFIAHPLASYLPWINEVIKDD